MESTQPPIRVICPGRVYRNEAISARAHCFFHQVEGLYVDRHVSFTDLKQVLLLFAQEMFGKDTKIRLRPSYFPSPSRPPKWTSAATSAAARAAPSARGPAGWRFWAAAWLTPAVLDANGIDSTQYQGYAFGMGVERITNLKYQSRTCACSPKTTPVSSRSSWRPTKPAGKAHRPSDDVPFLSGIPRPERPAPTGRTSFPHILLRS